MWLIDRRNAVIDRRQHEIPVWGNRRTPKEEKLYREKIEKEWAVCDPTKEKVPSKFETFSTSIIIILFLVFIGFFYGIGTLLTSFLMKPL